MNIRDAMAELLVVQRSIEIADPAPLRVNEAFLIPPQAEGLHAALPCWTNTVRLNAEERMGDVARWRSYTVNMRLHVALQGEGDDERAGDVALAFMEAIHQAFGVIDADGHGGVALGGTVTQTTLRGTGGDTLVLFEGPRTIGLDLLLDLEIKDAGPLPNGFS